MLNSSLRRYLTPSLVGIALLSVLLALLASSTPAGAGGQVFTVTRFDDPVPIALPFCPLPPGSCSLREAVRAANAQTGNDTIILSAGTYTLTQAGLGRLDITESVAIHGVSAEATAINGGGMNVFWIDAPGPCCIDVSIKDVTIRNASGAAVHSRDNLTIENSVIRNNAGTGVSGHSTDGRPLVAIVNSTIRDNISGPATGGVWLDNVDGLIANSTISGNTGCCVGGGVLSWNGANTSILNSTISGNSPQTTGDRFGGGIYNDGPLELINVTIHDNTAAIGGGIYNAGAASDLVMTNTIVAGNHAPTAPDCSGSITSSGRDIIQDISGCTVSGSFNPLLLGLDPQLGPLANYGGPTETHILRAHSPAIDAGDDGTCPQTDQRSVSRPVEFNFEGPPLCDIGAFEAQPWCSADRPMLSIPDNDPAGVSDTQTQQTLGTIDELIVCVSIPHSWVGDLVVTLEHENTGTTATLIDRPGLPGSTYGCSGDDIFASLWPSTGTVVEVVCDPKLPTIGYDDYFASELAAFSGEALAGDWTLTVSDHAGGDTGVLERWALFATLASATPTPIDGGTPTPASATPSPSPTPSASPTATAAGSPTVTATPKPSDSATPTPTASPSGDNRIWGDNNCSQQVDPVDSLFVLRADAGLSTNTGDCPDMGQVVDVQNASPHPWGDVDCGGEVTPVDSLKLLRYDAGLGVAQAVDCPIIGSDVTISL